MAMVMWLLFGLPGDLLLQSRRTVRPPSCSTAGAELADSGGAGELVAPLTVPSDTVLLGVEGWDSEPPKGDDRKDACS